MEKTPVRTPRGVKDFIPPEAEEKRAIEEKVRELFTLWGYREVITPTFEFAEVLGRANGGRLEEQSFRFFDREGEVLTLRSDVTAPIARLVATRLAQHPLPLRLFYIANVFRHGETGVGRHREFYQAGVELIGAREPRADAEIVLLSLLALQAAGIPDVRVDVGHVGFFNAVLEDAGLHGDDEERIRQAALRKDLVELEAILVGRGVPSEGRRAVETLVRLRGGEEVLAEASRLARGERAREALADLEEIWAVLEASEARGRIWLDLGMVKDLGYYTGLILEGYAPQLGFTLCTGGRYDRLIGQFDSHSLPAVGFALGVERVMQVLALTGRRTAKPRPALLLVAEGAVEAEVSALAGRVRAAGVVVAREVMERSAEERMRYARESGLRGILTCRGGGGSGGLSLFFWPVGSSSPLPGEEIWDIMDLLKLMQRGDEQR